MTDVVESRDGLPERIATALDVPVTVVGVALLVRFLLEPAVPALDRGWWTVLDWGPVNALFAVELGARAAASPGPLRYVRRHWWELALIALPFLRFVRAVRAGRAVRAARGFTLGLRSVRRAGAKLRDRLLWLTVTTAIVALVSGRVLWEYGAGAYRSYPRAIHDAGHATISGEPLLEGGVGDWLELVLAAYSVVVIGVITSALAAYFTERYLPDPAGEVEPSS